MAKKAKCMADGGIINNAAEYWADDNAQFEKTNPEFVDRVVRALNPMTGVGSAMGAMHTAASSGDVPGMVMAGATAIPAFGVLRAVPAVGAAKATVAPSLRKTMASLVGGATANAASDEYQARQNPAYARGGIVRGKGGVDRVPMAIGGVNVNLTGGKKPEAVLPGKTVEAMGGPSAVESLIEATNGKPPVKGGLKEGGNYRYGANGEWIPDPEEDKAPAGGQPFGPAVPTLGQGLTGMSSAISGIGVSNPPPAVMPAAPQVSGNFNVAGNEYSSAPTSQPGVQRITAPGTSPLYTNIDRGSAVSGMNGKMAGGDATNVLEKLNRYAEMIDAMNPSGGSGGHVLGEVAPGMTQTDIDNAEKTARWRQDDLIGKLGRGHGSDAAIVAALGANARSNDVAGTNSAQLQSAKLQNQAARYGHDINAQRAAENNRVQMRGQDLTSAETAARLGLDKEKLGILQADAARMGSRTALENTKTQGEIDDQKMLREARAGLTSAISSGDPRKIEQARTAAVAAGIKFDKPDVSADYKPDGMGMGGTAVQRSQDGSLITTRIGADGKVAPPVRIAAPGATMAQKPVPAGHMVVGTSGGKRVLQDASGKRFIESE